MRKNQLRAIRTSPNHFTRFHLPSFRSVEMRDKIFKGMSCWTELKERPPKRIAGGNGARLSAQEREGVRVNLFDEVPDDTVSVIVRAMCSAAKSFAPERFSDRTRRFGSKISFDPSALMMVGSVVMRKL